MKIFSLFTILFLIGGLVSADFVRATTVQNNVSVNASTGGNSAGSENAGKGQASVSVETVVDDEVVQQIEEHKESKTGEAVQVEKDLEYNSGNVKINSQANAEGNTHTQEQHNQAQHKKQVEARESVESSEHGQTDEQTDQEEQVSNGSKSLISSVVEFFRNLFSGFFA